MREMAERVRELEQQLADREKLIYSLELTRQALTHSPASTASTISSPQKDEDPKANDFPLEKPNGNMRFTVINSSQI